MSTAPSVSVAADTPSHPDWSTITDDVHCPLCEYNLRGLSEPRCPECGYRFDWPELLDVTRRAHPYLFEHHAERNVWSFFRTLIGGLRPARFWRSLHPTQPSRPRRILLYAMLTLMPTTLMWIAQAVISIVMEVQRQRALQLQFLAAGFTTNSPPALTIVHMTNIFRWNVKSDDLLQIGFGCIVWPWFTLGGLLVFQWSMWRANIRRVHVLRCVVYSADLLAFFWPVYGLFAAEFWLNHFSSRFGGRHSPLGLFAYVVADVVLLLFNYRLMQAYRRYLRFDHVVATVLASQVMAALAVWKLLLMLQGY